MREGKRTTAQAASGCPGGPEDIKKSYKHSGKLTSVLYELVSEESKTGERFSVTGVLDALGLSKSGYYSYLQRTPSQQALRKEEVKKEIQVIYNESHQNYGAPKIGVLLRRQGYTITDRTVGIYMREMDIRAQWVKKKPVCHIKSSGMKRFKNILKQQFNPEHPDSVWCTDITYIYTKQEGFVYLTCIMDLYSRKIIAWKLSRTMEVEDILEALKTAKIRRQTSNPVVLHTDRGVHFTSEYYNQLTDDMIRSYSKKGYPYDNACIESFHSLIKREWLNLFDLQNYWQVYRLCDEYIEGFYNSVRIHSHCGFIPPAAHERIWKEESLHQLNNQKSTGAG